MAVAAIDEWKKWNQEIEMGTTLPPGFSSRDTIFVNNGNLTMTSKDSLPQFELDTIQSMTKAGLGDAQVILSNADDVARAEANGFVFAVNPFNRDKNFGLLDTQGGFVYADKACSFALHKARTLGVRLVLGDSKGRFSDFIWSVNSRVSGVRTADGISHLAELTIMACGGWPPSLVPQLDNLCETTAGSVCIFKVPKNSSSWDRLAPERFPTWTYVPLLIWTIYIDI